MLNDKKEMAILSGLINDFNGDKKLIYSSNIKISNEITNRILKNNDFIWPEIEVDYLRKYLEYFQKIDFLTKE